MGTDSPISTEGLAREVLALLKLQNEYFKRKSPDILRECKAAEKRLAKLCEEVINPSLFGGGA